MVGGIPDNSHTVVQPSGGAEHRPPPPPSAPSLSASTPLTSASSSTLVACTTLCSAPPLGWTTVWLLSGMVARVARTTGWSRTRGAAHGESGATSRCPGTGTTTVASLPWPSMPSPNLLHYYQLGTDAVSPKIYTFFKNMTLRR